MSISRMRESKSVAFVASCTIVTMAWLTFVPTVALAETISLPAGTPVRLRVDTPIIPEGHNVGDRIGLTVSSDVVIDGNVVIAAGAEARAEIVQAKNRGMIGIPAKIGLSVRSVEAVDGTTIPLYATKVVEGKDKMVMSIGLSLICCILFALMKGGDATIPAGTEIIAETAGSISVTI